MKNQKQKLNLKKVKVSKLNAKQLIEAQGGASGNGTFYKKFSMKPEYCPNAVE